MLRRSITTAKKCSSVFSHTTKSTGSLSLLVQSKSKSTVAGHNDIDSKLRSDIRNLGTILGNSIKGHDAGVFEAVEKLRALGKEWRTPNGRKSAFEDMVAEVKGYDSHKLLGISRSFSNFLSLCNSAENHHRIRRLRETSMESGVDISLWPSKTDSCGGNIKRLLEEGKTPDEVIKALTSQQVELVLTAHPTEVNRRTMIKFHHEIRELLEESDNEVKTKYEKRQIQKKLCANVGAIWDSDDLRRSKPTPVDEAKVGLAIVENVLWKAVPGFIRKLDDICENEMHQKLPLDFAPIKMASWMGGDRDGNPNVTPEITLEVSMLSRWTAATLFRDDLKELRSFLSLRTCSDELRTYVGQSREPYREVVKQLEARLEATIDWTLFELGLKEEFTTTHGKSAEPIKKTSDLLDPLTLLHRSLVSTGFADIADGALIDTIRRAAVFGMALTPLDLRQESHRHTEALDAITNYLGLGSYLQWDELTRREWLLKELASRRPLLPARDDFSKDMGFSPTVVDTLETFKLAARLEDGSLGAYVISQCQQASDILAVMLLQQDAGVKPLLRVVPLFETLDDLQRSAATIDALFSMELYLDRIKMKQEIMVGYSDSAKDAGRLAASWAQYNAQVAMMEVAKKHGDIEITFFHGKGGTVGRGGNPALYQAILAHPPGTINGRFRVTEQGEMITQNFGLQAVAERTLDLFTAGVLAERFLERPSVKPEWIEMMEKLSDSSCDAYRAVVRGEPRFVPYFRSATPELELAGLNVGSRPAKRNPKGGVESLRAIPWVFAWTQTRLNLPTWLGVGEAISAEMKKDPTVLIDMYKNWPWFYTLIDLLEMILIKSEAKIAENYDIQLVSDPESVELGKELREKMELTTKAVLSVSNNKSLQQDNRILLRSLEVRNPYVDPLNIIQAELLARLRKLEESGDANGIEMAVLKDALLITINGVANGMRNSG